MTTLIMSRHSPNYTESDDDTTPEAIAKRLRDKIRLQAEALLSRCDASTYRSNHNLSRHSSRVSTDSMLADATTETTGSTGMSPSSSTPSLHNTSGVSTLDVTICNSNRLTDTLTNLQSPTANSTAVIVTPSTNPKSYDDRINQDSSAVSRDGHTTNEGNSSCSTTRSSSPSIVSHASTTGNSRDTSAHDLTKRIQKLALERQSHPSNHHLFHQDSNQQRLKIIQSDTSSHLSSVKTFEELNLPIDLLHAIYQMGFNRPSYIQEITLPRILQGRNVIGQAQSGSGKVRHFLSFRLLRSLSVHVCHLTTFLPILSFSCSITGRRSHLPLGCCIALIQLAIQHRLCVSHQLVNWPYRLWKRRSRR